ncbi:MAG: cation transporter [Gammaproteobacteria bacterium]|nr:cation transporter [Gammaproteobacteria bacterium]MCP5198245.1 cation transporter [Gammaproteobacteria bacterium]
MTLHSHNANHAAASQGAHHHHSHTASGDPLVYALALTLGYASIETLGGYWSGSLALLSDAGHMVTDGAALAIAAFAARLAARPVSLRHSYGFVRAEILAGFLNALLMLAVIIGITVSAVQRLHAAVAVDGETVTVIALVGLAVNIVVAIILARGERTLNLRAALLHVMGDLLGSVAALLAGVIVALTGWMPADPILALLIALLILVSTLRLLREALHALMEGTPLHLRPAEVGAAVLEISGVRAVHDLHIWSLSSERIALSAHLVIDDLREWPHILPMITACLHERFEINHVTLQPEPSAWPVVWVKAENYPSAKY